MGGWASNSKYPFLSALRSAAQMISYEVSIGFVITRVVKQKNDCFWSACAPGKRV